MKVLIIDNYDSFTYNLFHYIKGIVKDVTVKRNDEISIKEIEHFSHIVLSPGPGLPKDAGILMSCLKHFTNTKPILGICLGMQAIAEHFGGELYNQEWVKHGIQEEINILETDGGIFNELSRHEKVGLYHSWAVKKENLPEKLTVIAEGKTGVIMGLKHQILPVSGVQFHPESILTTNGKKIIENWLSQNP